jgi:DNA-binding LacI/PurR family transcriptional regulator
MAFAVLETLKHELGLDVPHEVSVVGYDDVAMAAWKTFDLTTLRQPANRMAEATVRMLLSMIDDSEPSPGRIEIESQLIVRGSTRNPAGWQRDP